AYTAATFYRYSQPGEKVKTLVYNPTLKKLEETPMALGTTEDIAMYESSVSDISNDFSLELDLDITLCCAVTLGFGLTYDRSEQELNQHVTSKVLWQKSYLLATTTVADGVTQTTQNVAFNRQNGEPVLTCTYDGFMEPQEPIHTEKSGSLRHDGYYYTLNVPASWMFPTMGKRFNQGVENPANSNQLSASAGKVVTYGASPVTAGLIGRVVSAEATIYKNDWFNSNLNQTMLDADFGLNALAKQALNKHWYPLRSYVYRDAVTDANSAADRIYSGGLYGVNNSIDFWGVYTGNSANTIINNNWFSPSQIVSYSPHGYPMEEVDALGVRSIVKFGYNNTLPVLVAQNADYNSAFFYDYEYGPNGTVCLNAHSGSKAFNLSQSPNAALLNGVMTQNVKNKGGSIRLWLHSKVPNSGTKNPNPGLKALVAGKITPFTKVAETGDWALYEARITDWGTLAVNASFAVRLQYNFASNETVWIDDFRFQPLEAAMSCTSYTPDFKVAVQFDDQHFGTYYEYNALGQLVRKSVETERGRKILQEQQSHTPLVIR
ncbi:MAG: hypothetical protein ABIQ93_13820, partial [Saprospiraceae bacterium]